MTMVALLASAASAAPALYQGSLTGPTSTTNSSCAPSDPVCVDPSVRVTNVNVGSDSNGCLNINVGIHVRAEITVLNRTETVNRTIGVNETVCAALAVPSAPGEANCRVDRYQDNGRVADAQFARTDYLVVAPTTTAPQTWHGDLTITYFEDPELQRSVAVMDIVCRPVALNTT